MTATDKLARFKTVDVLSDSDRKQIADEAHDRKGYVPKKDDDK